MTQQAPKARRTTRCSMTGEICSEPRCQGGSDDLCQFDQWITALREDVIEGEYGYEEGEFDVFPAMWHPLYKEGLTPTQAWQRALDAYREAR